MISDLRRVCWPVLRLCVVSVLAVQLLHVNGDSTSPACRSVMPKCASGGACPDLVIDGPRVQATSQVALSDFYPGDCAVVEGCTQVGRRKLLRFDIATGNNGTQDLVLGNPADPKLSPCFNWSSCHEHYHFTAYADYSLIDGGAVVARGAKASSCIMDGFRMDNSNAPIVNQFYDCNNQGIHVGYQDVYGGHLDCQWIDVTGVAAGTYTLRVGVNINNVMPESNYLNNYISVPVVVPADADTPVLGQPNICNLAGSCSDCTAMAGCGWCASFGYCAGGTYLGPSGGSCGAWTWSGQTCSATAPPQAICTQSTCSECTGTSGCGWCATTKSCVAGTWLGPTVSNSCPVANWTWAVTTCPSTSANGGGGGGGSVAVSSTGSAGGGSVSASTGRAGGGSTGSAVSTSTGNAVSTSTGSVVSTSTGSAGGGGGGSGSFTGSSTGTAPPTTTPTLKACAGSGLTVSGNAARGNCPSGSNLLPSGQACQLACNAGYTLAASTGIKQCTNGAWSGSAPTCSADPCALPSSALAGTSAGTCLNGASIASGSSCTYTALSGWALQSGTLKRTCAAGAFTTGAPLMKQTSCVLPSPSPAGTSGGCTAGATLLTGASCTYTLASGWQLVSGTLKRTCSSGAFSTAAPVLQQTTTAPSDSTCAALTICSDCSARAGCGWCPEANSCWSGTSAGPTGHSCSLWQFGSQSQCGDCASQHTCDDCASATGCGWCASNGKCYAGTYLGPGSYTCPNKWVWSAATCSPTPVASSTAAVCAASTACTACTGKPGCGWCASTSTCSVGTTSAPSSGTCSNWAWFGTTCSSTATSTTVASKSLAAAAPRLSRVAAPDADAPADDAAGDSDSADVSAATTTPADVSLPQLPLPAPASVTPSPDVVSVGIGLKADPAGNFLKWHGSDALRSIKRPAVADGRRNPAVHADVKPPNDIGSVEDPFDPYPYDRRFPHGHVERMEHDNKPHKHHANTKQAQVVTGEATTVHAVPLLLLPLLLLLSLLMV